MSMFAEFRHRLLKSVPLSMALILAGAIILTPAVGGAAAFLTKQQGNKLFLGNTNNLSQTQTFANGNGGEINVLCPPGQQATGGGASSPATIQGSTMGATALMLHLESSPINSGGRSVGWHVEVFGQNTAPGGTLAITAHAVCTK